LGAFLLFAPAAFVLLPLALLLLLSRPTRPATWIWIGVGGLWSASWLVAPGPLAEQVLKGWTVVAGGTFLLLALDPRRRTVDAAITAALTASLATLAWMGAFRVDFPAVVADALRSIWATYRALGDAAPGLRAQLAGASDSAASAAIIFPGAVMLAGIAGLTLAWRWYHRLADAPVGAPPGRFLDFRFSDHFIWLLVAGMAGTFAQLSGTMLGGASWPANLLVVFITLYAARGLAVTLWATTSWGIRTALPVSLLLAALLFVLFLLPFVLAGLLGIGLADTWLDFRHRPAVAPGE
jgi:hypothetical protein